MLLRLKVKPNAKKDEIVREADGSLRVKIRAQAIEGKANKYLLEYLSGLLNLPKTQITLLKGETTSFKTFEIKADESYVMDKLAGL